MVDFWKSLYRFYVLSILPRVDGIRGSVFLKRKLLRMAFSDKKVEVNGVEIYMSIPRDFSEIYQTIEYRVSNYDLREGDVVVDAGAYPGEFTIYASKKVGEGGKIIAFEPNPVNFRRLKKNVILNNLDNVVLVQKGLWDEVGEMEMVGMDVGSNFGALDDYKYDKENVVGLISLDDYFQENDIQGVDFIKVDVEGAELEVLKGMKNILKRYLPKLAIASYHIRDGEKTFRRVEKILTGFDYDVQTPSVFGNMELTTFGEKVSEGENY